ncbi:MAG: nucleotidyl transferase AbiEii/AbiGii toxin family protein [Nocardioidaceae bacterium]
MLELPDGISIRVQLLDGRGYAPWPVERRRLEQRYSDAEASSLTVPTVESFAGSNAAAWHDRAAARDLYDLWVLAERGSLTAAAAELFAKYGPTGGRPRSHLFAEPPSESAWQARLAGHATRRVRRRGHRKGSPRLGNRPARAVAVSRPPGRVR